MAGFHAPIETQLAANANLVAIGFDPVTRRKAHLAVADLSVMGEVGSAPCATDTLDVSDLYAALGAAYVTIITLSDELVPAALRLVGSAS